MQVEHVARDLSQLSHADKAAALEADAPELLALLGDMEAGLSEVRASYVCVRVCFRE